jgi:hypothetical protein
VPNQQGRPGAAESRPAFPKTIEHLAQNRERLDLPAPTPQFRFSAATPRVSDLDSLPIVFCVKLVRLGDVIRAVEAIEPILIFALREGRGRRNKWRISVQRKTPRFLTRAS